MKQFNLLLLLLGIINVAGSSPPDANPSTIVKYHGTKRYWTSVDSDGKTYLALNILKEAVNGPIKLLFPKDKDLGQVLSDITLYSVANAQCRADINTLTFKLEFDGQNFINGVVSSVRANKIMASMYDVCNGVASSIPYASLIVDRQYSIIDGPGRTCFLEGDPFQADDKDNTTNVMKLEVSGSFKCQVFMTLPSYLVVEDEALPSDSREPINATFAEQGEEFWWKSVQNESFSNGIFFYDRDVAIDMKASTKDIPYFLRIGKDQPYPSLNFKFDPACSNQEYDLYVNLRSGDCKINLALTRTGIKVTTKGVTSEILDATKSPTMVFARGQSKVYVKAGSHLAVAAKDVCQIENVPDVPADQFVLQIAPSENFVGCNSAQVILPGGDVNKIEVLLDRVKAAAFLAHSVLDQNGTTEMSGNFTAAPVHADTTTKTADAGFPWWWILVGLILVLLVGGIGLGIFFFIRWCLRKQKAQKECQRPKSPAHWDQNSDREYEKIQRALKTETAIPVEEPSAKKKKSKKKKRKSKKPKKMRDIGRHVSSSSESKKSVKEVVEEKRKNQYEVLPPLDPKKAAPKSPKKPTQDQCSAIQSTQNETTIATASTQIPSKQTVEKVLRAKLNHRTIYGPAGFVHMNDPFEYHQNESSTFDSKINFASVKSPPLLKFENFWSCIDKLCEPKRFGGIFVNSKTQGKNIYFIVRDCVADEALYAPFRSLSTRILEPIKQHSGDGEKNFIIRVFILAYEPLTMEIHCRGQCPQFLFNLFDCEECPDIGKKLEKNPNAATSGESWQSFVCRVKRTPINSHQFLSYNGPQAKVKNADEINHLMVIRGEKKPNKLRECSRGCSFKDSSHPNNFTLEAELSGDPTIATQNTQQPSSN